jgi:hypothetical protein
MSFSILLPGDILGEWVVERLFWQSDISLMSMTVMSTALMVAINWIVWLAAVKTARAIYARRSGRQGGAE